MNKKNIDWDNYEEDFEKRFVERDLEGNKRNSILFLESKGNYASREMFHAHWETYLNFSDYFKNWREKINSFQTTQEVNFYTDRLGAFIDFVKENTRKKVNYIDENYPKQWDPRTTPNIIEQELKRLENISEEDFKKEDKFASVELKELSVEEMKNDPWFSNEIDRLFGLENKSTPPQTCTFCSNAIDPLQWVCANKKYFCNSKCMSNWKPKKDDNNSVDYRTSTCKKIIAEINRLEAENEELKNNQTLVASEKESRLKENQKKLERLNSYYDNFVSQSISQPNSSNDKFPTGWVVGGGVLLVIIGLGTLLFAVKKNKEKR